MVASYSLRRNGDSLLAALIGFLIIILFTRHSGIGISPDSVVYASVAENFANHGRLWAYSHNTLIEFPPLYSIFLAAISLVSQMKPIAFAPILNASLFAVLIYYTGGILEECGFRPRLIKVAVLSCIVLSPCLLEVYSMLWTETIFLIWVILFLITMRLYLQSHLLKTLILAAVLAALAAVTRYAGVSLIGAGSLFILLDKGMPVPKKAIRALIFFGLSCSLLLLELVRNHWISGTLTGHREGSTVSWLENLRDTGTVFSDWLPFFSEHAVLSMSIGIILILALCFFLVNGFKRRSSPPALAYLAAGFSLFYIIFMITIASISRFEPLDSRFFSPVFIPILCCASGGIVAAARRRKWLIYPALIFFVGFQYRQLQSDLETWDGVKDSGIPGYTEDEWKQSPTVSYMLEDSIFKSTGASIYSDAYDAVYFFTGRTGFFLPHRENPEELRNFLADPHCYLVWLDDGENPDLVDLSFITKVKGMKLLKDFEDGSIYVYDRPP